MSSLAKYNTPILVVVIMIALAMTHTTDAIHKHVLRPINLAIGPVIVRNCGSLSYFQYIPANVEVRKAPRIINEEMSC